MSKFKGEQCPICRVEFSDTDDVVVCPDCGTPHHRSCYSEFGECFNRSSHGDGFEWKSRVADLITVLEERERRDQALEEQRKEEKAKAFADDFEARNIFGVSKAELSAYMEIPAGTYVYKMKIEHAKTVNINIFAGLLAPFYQFYKGMRLLGVLLMAPLVLLSVPELFLSMEIEQPYNFLVSIFGSIESVNTFANFFKMAILVLLVLFNDYIYLRFCAFKIKKIRLNFPESDTKYYDELRKRGMSSIFRAIVESLAASTLMVFILYVLLS